MTGSVETPITTAIGWVFDGAVAGSVDGKIEATFFFTRLAMASTAVWVKNLYVTGSGKSLG